MNRRLEGQVAIVTGAGQGIGAGNCLGARKGRCGSRHRRAHRVKDRRYM